MARQREIVTNVAQRPRFTLGRALYARRVPGAFSGSGSQLTPRERLRARRAVHPTHDLLAHTPYGAPGGTRSLP